MRKLLAVAVLSGLFAIGCGSSTEQSKKSAMPDSMKGQNTGKGMSTEKTPPKHEADSGKDKEKPKDEKKDKDEKDKK